LDFDGTLVDSYPLIEWAFAQVCVAHQLAPEARERFAAARGLPLPEQMRCVSATLWEELTVTYRRLDAERGRHARVFPGILPILRQAQRQGLSLSVVSSKRRQLVLTELQASGLEAFFPVVVALEDAPAAKPHAAPLRVALQLMGIKPSQALYVGDTLVDMEAGRRARVHTMLAAWGLSPALQAQMNGHFPRLLHPRELLPIILGKHAAQPR
jgi:pyrophosphatase PpaX